MKTRLVLAATLCSVLWAAAALAAPRLDLVMKPHATGDQNSYLAVSMTLESPRAAAGETLIHIPLKIVGIPTARYDGNAISARDDSGPLDLTAEDEPPTPQWIYRHWKVSRATVGDVVVTYQAPPRKITATTNNGPLFDLREEAGGFAGAGVGFLALPVKDGPYQVHLKWDLSDAPPGSRGEWSLADGDTTVEVPAQVLAFSYYAVGLLHSIPSVSNGKFGLYWLGQPSFDVSVLGERIMSLYGTLSTFFGDTDSSYRVFMRQNPYEGTGGSALAHSFMFGYNPPSQPTVDDLQDLLAHEMTHNWPEMDGEHGDTAWYSEGTAEYYSLLLSHRGGQLTTEKYLADINERADAYYSNPYLNLTNPQAAKIFWTDPIAQTVPYGRGFLYLVNTDAEIRAQSHGKHSLDDVVLEIYRRGKSKEAHGVPQWLELVGKELGAKRARSEYDAMVAGTTILPAKNRFSPCFTVAHRVVHVFQLGFARASLNDGGVIHDLVPGSAADRAGIRDGDQVVAVHGLVETRKHEDKPLTLTLRHGTTQTEVTYTPRGAEVPGYGWVRNPRAAEGTCKF